MVMKGISDYLDRLSPDDRVGLVSLPYNSPRVDLTTNRQLIKHAASQIVGASTSNQDIQMTVGEAAAVEQLDSVALQDYLDRIQAACHDTPPGVVGLPDDPTVSCTLRWQPMALRIMTAERHRTQRLFDSLRAGGGMAPIEGPKSIVLVRGSSTIARRSVLQSFATAAGARHACGEHRRFAYGRLQQDSTCRTRIRDHQVLLDGMATLAVSARSNAFDVSGTPAGALARIDAEVFCLLSFEREPAIAKASKKIQVTLNWPDSTVRAARFATMRRRARGHALEGPESRHRRMLRWRCADGSWDRSRHVPRRNGRVWRRQHDPRSEPGVAGGAIAATGCRSPIRRAKSSPVSGA